MSAKQATTLFFVIFILFIIFLIPKSYFLNFRMWFKNGLKAQKLLAQGIALGIIAVSKAPCKGKSLIFLPGVLKLLPLQGDRFASVIPQGDALVG